MARAIQIESKFTPAETRALRNALDFILAFGPAELAHGSGTKFDKPWSKGLPAVLLAVALNPELDRQEIMNKYKFGERRMSKACIALNEKYRWIIDAGSGRWATASGYELTGVGVTFLKQAAAILMKTTKEDSRAGA